ncbi:MAG: LysM peptidoglycan-binding domain-containing protein [Actinomycetota bacterium]
MSDLPLTWMADAFRKNGLRVKEVQGWKTRGRDGTFDPRGVIFHHTASSEAGGPTPALGVVTNGRSDLPGPLCNVLVARDGTVHLIAAGRSNHAGEGGPFRNIPEDSGNSFLAGVEVENNGLGEPWKKDLLDTLDVVFATMLMGLRRGPRWLIGHKEWTTRKIDPGDGKGGLDMGDSRDRARKQMRAIASGKQGPSPGRKHGHGPSPTRTHVVQSGDTLFAIALEHHMSVAELKRINGLQSDVIHVGDKLKVRG